MIYLPDYHVHSRFSCDSDAEMAAACEAAIARGLSEIAFTDHADFGPVDPSGYFRPTEYLAEIERCRARYGGRLTIRAGVEMGEPHIFAQEAASVLAAGEFDFVLGSAHYAVGMQPAWKPAFFEQPLRQAYEAYFQQVARLAAEGDFDVLAHLDLVKRDAHKFGKTYDGPGPYADVIRAALRSIVERGKGIEINTSALHRGQPETCPSLQVLRWYRELGGDILTFGSDAHTPDAVGACFDVALEMARSAGFARLATFERRKVMWMTI
ncbi:MAG: histidinol-phosphatase HisJ family protein [Chloroflexota bacterium]|nr:histidinol-phosphatase HisJ family protein [Chloroflexota bacterium]